MYRETRGTGGQNPNYRILEALAAPEGRKYFVLIVDCVGDNRVKSKITDNYQSLVSNGYQAIIGIRDVYPDVAYHDIAKLRRGLDYKVKTKPIQVVFILGVMEIETWFITEHTHFQKMDARLTMARIRGALGFDPSVDDIQLRPNRRMICTAFINLLVWRTQRAKQGYREPWTS